MTPSPDTLAAMEQWANVQGLTRRKSTYIRVDLAAIVADKLRAKAVAEARQAALTEAAPLLQAARIIHADLASPTTEVMPFSVRIGWESMLRFGLDSLAPDASLIAAASGLVIDPEEPTDA